MNSVVRVGNAIDERAVQLVLTALKNRVGQLEGLDRTYWKVQGTGSIGDKASELRQKTDAIRRAGFELNPRNIFASGFFDGFRKKAELTEDLDPIEADRRIRRAIFSDEEKRLLLKLLRGYSGPFAVRSSALGDARGTGIFYSGFVANNEKTEEGNLGRLIDEIKKVLTSSYSKNAKEYRRKHDLGNEIAVIVEPVIGRRLTGSTDQGFEFDEWASDLGGVGFTNTAKSEPYMRVTMGLPTKAVSERSAAALNPGMRLSYAVDRLNRLNSQAMDISASLRGNYYNGSAEVISLKHRFPKKRESTPAKLDTEGIFAKMRLLEAIIGKPQYIEFASIVMPDGSTKTYVLQIADAVPNLDTFEFLDVESFISSRFVWGSGDKRGNRIVLINGPSGLPELDKFNAENSGYLVIYSSKLVGNTTYSSFVHNSVQVLGYQHISNSSVLVELPSEIGSHANPPAQHFLGGIEDKILFALPKHPSSELQRLSRYTTRTTKLSLKESDWLVFAEYTVPWRVIASEKQGKGVIILEVESFNGLKLS